MDLVIDRLVASQPTALLTMLAREGIENVRQNIGSMDEATQQQIIAAAGQHHGEEHRGAGLFGADIVRHGEDHCRSGLTKD